MKNYKETYMQRLRRYLNYLSNYIYTNNIQKEGNFFLEQSSIFRWIANYTAVFFIWTSQIVPIYAMDTDDSSILHRRNYRASKKITIKDLQLSVHDHVKRVGGYWRPLSGLARIIEEYGEVCQAICLTPDDLTKIDQELADLFIITTCLANQYCSNLLFQYSAIGLPKDLATIERQGKNFSDSEENRVHLTMASIIGELARVVNYYEGDKKPKKGEILPTVENLVAQLHKSIWHYAKEHNAQLIDQIYNWTLDKRFPEKL